VLVQGSGFVAGDTDVRLKMTGEPDIVATDVTVAGDGNSLTCDIDLAGAAGGARDVVVSTPLCPPATLTDGFLVRLCPDPFADADEDDDVDQDDFGALQTCFTGPGGGVLAGCACFNRDADNDVDEDDYGAFEDCASGPEVPASTLCDGPPS
jgi:hypothetical protein